MSAEAGTYSRETMALPAGPIENERLLLRPLTLDDVEMMVQMDSDPDVMEFIKDYLVAPEDIDEYREILRRDVAEGIRFKFALAVTLRDAPDDGLGWVILRPTEDGRWIEIGYRLAKRVWGQGIAPEASRRLLKIAFDDWGVAEVMAVIDPGNRKSSRVVQKLDFILQPEPIHMYDMDLELWVLKSP